MLQNVPYKSCQLEFLVKHGVVSSFIMHSKFPDLSFLAALHRILPSYIALFGRPVFLFNNDTVNRK